MSCCYFHFCQAIFKKIKEMHCYPAYQRDALKVCRAVRRVFGLAFLPINRVASTLDEIEVDFNQVDLEDFNQMPVPGVVPVAPGLKASEASIAGASGRMWETAATEAASNACAGALEDEELEDAELKDAELEDAELEDAELEDALAPTASPSSSSSESPDLFLLVSLSPLSPLSDTVFAPDLVAAAFRTAFVLLLGGLDTFTTFAALAPVCLTLPILRLCIEIVSRIVEECGQFTWKERGEGRFNAEKIPPFDDWFCYNMFGFCSKLLHTKMWC
jgi:hypothetical protein